MNLMYFGKQVRYWIALVAATASASSFWALILTAVAKYILNIEEHSVLFKVWIVSGILLAIYIFPKLRKFLKSQQS